MAKAKMKEMAAAIGGANPAAAHRLMAKAMLMKMVVMASSAKLARNRLKIKLKWQMALAKAIISV